MPVEMYESRKESARPEDSEQISGGSAARMPFLTRGKAACRRGQPDNSEAEVKSVGILHSPGSESSLQFLFRERYYFPVFILLYMII